MHVGVNLIRRGMFFYVHAAGAFYNLMALLGENNITEKLDNSFVLSFDV